MEIEKRDNGTAGVLKKNLMSQHGKSAKKKILMSHQGRISGNRTRKAG